MRNSYYTQALCLRALAFMSHPIRKRALTYLFIFFSKHFHVRIALKTGGFILISAGTFAVTPLAVIGSELFLQCTL